MEVFPVDLGGGRTARGVCVAALADLEQGVATLGLERRPALVVIGGAAGMDEAALERMRPLFDDVLAPLAARAGVAVLDGGTDAGVMRLVGRARAAGAHGFPLVGVVVDDLIRGDAALGNGPAGPEPNHTHFVLVPGSRWGEEGPWLAALAGAVAGPAGSATVLVNGGEIAWSDVRASVGAGRPVVALAGSGRTADAVAAAARGDRSDPRAEELAASRLLHACEAGDGDGVGRLLDELLRKGR